MTNSSISIEEHDNVKPIRYQILDNWICILVVLVISGHAMFPGHPAWYDAFHGWLYSFHMGAFFFVCGFLVCHTYRPISSISEYIHYIEKRLFKFGLPYLVLGIILTIISLYEQHSKMENLPIWLWRLVICPPHSKVIFLWFIYVLFGFYLIAPLLVQYCPPKLLIVIIIMGIFPALHWQLFPKAFCLNFFAKYLVFFLLGIFIRYYISAMPSISIHYTWCFFVAFLPASLLNTYIPYLVTCLLSLPCFYVFAWLMNKSMILCTISYHISKNCFGIYLLQMFFLHVSHRFWNRFIPLSLNYYLLFLLITIPVTIIGSLCITYLLNWIATYLKCQVKLLPKYH